MRQGLRKFVDGLLSNRGKDKAKDADEDGTNRFGERLKSLEQMAEQFFDQILKERKTGGKDEADEEGEDEGADEESPLNLKNLQQSIKTLREWIQSDQGRNALKQAQEGLKGLLDNRKGGERKLPEFLKDINIQDLLKDLPKYRKQIEDLGKKLGIGGRDGGRDDGEPADEDKGEDMEEGADEDAGAAQPEITPERVPAYLGIGPTDDEAGGVRVESVTDGSPAEDAGLKTNDRIVRFNGQKVENVNGLIELVAACRPGQKVELSVVRNGKRVKINATLGSRARGGKNTPRFIAPFNCSLNPLDEVAALSRFFPAPKVEPRKVAPKDTKNQKKPVEEQLNDDLDRIDETIQNLGRVGDMARLMRNFTKNQEFFWAVTNRDDHVLFKKKIDPVKMIGFVQKYGPTLLKKLRPEAKRKDGGKPAECQEPCCVAKRKALAEAKKSGGAQIELREERTSGPAGEKRIVIRRMEARPTEAKPIEVKRTEGKTLDIDLRPDGKASKDGNVFFTKRVEGPAAKKDVLFYVTRPRGARADEDADDGDRDFVTMDDEDNVVVLNDDDDDDADDDDDDDQDADRAEVHHGGHRPDRGGSDREPRWHEVLRRLVEEVNPGGREFHGGRAQEMQGLLRKLDELLRSEKGSHDGGRGRGEVHRFEFRVPPGRGDGRREGQPRGILRFSFGDHRDSDRDGACDGGRCDGGECKHGQHHDGGCEDGKCEHGKAHDGGRCEDGKCEHGKAHDGGRCEDGKCEHGKAHDGGCPHMEKKCPHGGECDDRGAERRDARPPHRGAHPDRGHNLELSSTIDL